MLSVKQVLDVRRDKGVIRGRTVDSEEVAFEIFLQRDGVVNCRLYIDEYNDEMLQVMGIYEDMLKRRNVSF